MSSLAPLSFDPRVSTLLEPALEACRRAGEILRAGFRRPSLGVTIKADGTPVSTADRDAEVAIREMLATATPGYGILGEELGAEGTEHARWVIDPIDGTKSFVRGLPFSATLLALEVDGEPLLGVVHAPLLGPGMPFVGPPARAEKAGPGLTWWAVSGQGAFAGTGTDPLSPWRRLSVSATRSLEGASVLHGELADFRRSGLWPALGRVVDAGAWTRGLGDWWGHVLVAEGQADAMLEARVALHDVAALELLIEEAGGAFFLDGPLREHPGQQGAALSSNHHLAARLRDLLQP
jgi:histidinol-phosphatase